MHRFKKQANLNLVPRPSRPPTPPKRTHGKGSLQLPRASSPGEPRRPRHVPGDAQSVRGPYLPDGSGRPGKQQQQGRSEGLDDEQQVVVVHLSVSPSLSVPLSLCVSLSLSLSLCLCRMRLFGSFVLNTCERQLSTYVRSNLCPAKIKIVRGGQ